MSSTSLYDQIADVYHLIYQDWDATIRHQAELLGSVIRDTVGDGPRRVLDVSCGIGTQALGLAGLGHRVTASDLSGRAVERARREAQDRNLEIDLSVADMRTCDRHHDGQFDVVLSADNSVPHLLGDDEILKAFRAMHRLTRPGGMILLTVRDYASEDRSTPQFRPHGIRTDPDGRWVVFQVWDFEGDFYDVSLFFVRAHADGRSETLVAGGRYYAVSADRLLALMREAGFVNTERLDRAYNQPVLIGRKSASA